MKRLWAPWRMKFVEKEKKKGCVFCEVLAEDADEKNLIVYRGKLAFVILNRYPYTSGHVMVVPNAHQPSFEFLDPPTRAEMMELSTRAVEVLKKVYSPEGLNLGTNIGEAAGAGIAEHVHIHVLPRWGGDTNFMSTVGQTRVIPEDLDETYRRISAAWF